MPNTAQCELDCKSKRSDQKEIPLTLVERLLDRIWAWIVSIENDRPKDEPHHNDIFGDPSVPSPTSA